MQSQPSAPLRDEILLALKDKIGTTLTVEALEEELQRYLDYGVPPEQARAAILRHYGAPPPQTAGGSSERRTLAELKPNESFVNLLVRVVAINEKEITARGEKKRIQYGILGDESMTRPFTAWKPIEAQKGQVVKIQGAYTKEYQGGAEVQLGDRAVLEVAADESVPKTPAPRTVKVAELASGMSNVELAARVLSVTPRSVTVQGTPKTVWSGILADATGKVGFTSWTDFGLKDGQAIRVRGGYVRSFRNTPQYTFDEKAALERLAEDALPPTSALEHAGPIALAELYVGGGALDVTVEATLLEVRPGSGLVLRCPQCKRVVEGDSCRLHGKVEGNPDLRIKGVLDDGTGAVSAIFDRPTTETILGKTLSECQALAKDAGDAHAVEAELKAKLLARPLRVRGNVVVDDFGPTLLVKEAQPLHRDLAAAAEALLAELEGAA